MILVLGLSYLYADSGASYAIICAEIVLLVMNFYYVRKTFSHVEVFDPKTFLHACTGALIFIPVVYLIKTGISSPVLVLTISIVTCVVLYFLVQLFIIKNEFMIILRDIIVKRGKKFMKSSRNDDAG